MERDCDEDRISSTPHRVSRPPVSLVRRWSTSSVAEGDRLDYFAAALSQAVVPFSVDDADPITFVSELSVSTLDSIEIAKTYGAAHRSFRGPGEFSRTDRHRINLLMTLDAPWDVRHRGDMRLAPGDILIHDTSFPIETRVRQPFSAVNIAVPSDWLSRWVPDPRTVTGRFISGRSIWGRALSSYIGELSPELVDAPPLPVSTMADMVGGLLALAVHDLGHCALNYNRASRSLYLRITDSLTQRCTEPALTATDISTDLGISLRTLHRTLAATADTFGGHLLQARVAIALRMLASPLFKRVTTAEIGRRAGFASGSHFARVVRHQTGKTPMQLRRLL